MMVEKVVTEGCQVRIYPDDDMVEDIEQNIGNYRFIKNQLLDAYNQMKSLFAGTGWEPNLIWLLWKAI